MNIRDIVDQSLKTRAATTLLDDMTFTVARAHEICGGARRTLALLAPMKATGTVLWIASRRQRCRLNPEGLLDWFNPGRLILVAANQTEDIFWTAEESLRSGIVPLTVLDLQRPAALTPVRRLHLAAEAGLERGQALPLCLLLAPGRGGAMGVESRWLCECWHSRTADRWHVERQRARGQPPANWTVTRKGGKWRACPQEYEMQTTDDGQAALHAAGARAVGNPGFAAAPECQGQMASGRQASF